MLAGASLHARSCRGIANGRRDAAPPAAPPDDAVLEMRRAFGLAQPGLFELDSLRELVEQPAAPSEPDIDQVDPEGRRSYDNSIEAWGGKGPLGEVPCFVVTHEPPASSDPVFTFVKTGSRVPSRRPRRSPPRSGSG